MKNRNRALRRHHAKRLKRKCSFYYNAGYYLGEKGSVVGCGICFVTPAGCSCWMCGNQRQVWGASIQEIKQRARYCD